VFAFSLVYAFADRTNANPVIDSVTFAGSPIDPAAGITVDTCTQASIDNCPTTPLDTIVPASSQEQDPSNKDVNGRVLNEEIWVDMYLTDGKLKHDVTILYDPASGRVPNTATDYTAPQTSGDHMLWVVVHDNRGGANWMQIPVHAR